MSDVSSTTKRRLAGLTLSTLSVVEGEEGRSSYQLIITPGSAEFPKRTFTFDIQDARQLAIEFDIIARLLHGEVDK